MSLEIISKDTEAMPTALLDIAKAQMRVDFTDDDEEIKRFIAAAIDYFEAFTDLAICETEAVWTPDEYDNWSGNRARVPIQPIREWTATGDDGTTDVTGDYRITGSTQGSGRASGLYLVAKASTATAPVPVTPGITLAIVAGYDDFEKIPASQLNLILRSAARLYEDRESTTDVSLSSVPDWFLEMMAGNWVPRV